MKKKHILSIAIPVGFCLFFYLASGFLYSDVKTPASEIIVNEEKPLVGKSVATAMVQRIPVTHCIQYPGLIEAFRTANLVFRVGGPLTEINVSPGDKVKKDDVLMQIDPRDFILDVELTQAQLDALNAKFDAMQIGAREEDILLLQATLDSAKAKLDFSEQELRRAKQLQTDHVISQSEYEKSVHERIAAQMDLRVAEQELAKGRAGARKEDIASTQAEIKALQTKLQAAKDRLSDTTLRAPFDGIVTNRMIENYEMVSTTPSYKEVIGLHDIAKLKVRVFLPESELIRRTKADRFEVDLTFSDIPNRRFKANLCEVNTKPTKTKGMYAATFCFDAPTDMTILPGMVADVFLTDRDSLSEQLVVPSTAVLGNGSGESFVWKVGDDSDIPVKTPIRRGPLTASGDYIILEGLLEGDRVVVEGNRFLSEGVKVNVVR